MQEKATGRRVSFVVPVFNEVDTLEELTRRIHEEADALPQGVVAGHDIVFVDDGSTDGSSDSLERLFRSDPRVTVLRFRKNFGKAAALRAGFERATGDVVFTLDADLQDDPAEIGSFLATLDGGFDLVSGWKARRHDPLSKTLPSKLFNFVVSRSTGLELHDFNCGFKCMRREVAKSVALYGEMHRFVPALAHAKGFRVGEIKVRHHPRRFGRSKYGIGRLPKGLCDFLSVMVITRHARTALHAFGAIGLLVAAGGAALGTVLLTSWLSGDDEAERLLVWLSIVLGVSGLHIVLFGLLADLLSRHTTRGRSDDAMVAGFLAHGAREESA